MKVLLVDDEEHVREGITLAVDWRKFGVTEVLEAEDGRQALALAREHKPAVMFCDMNMPGMDGVALLRSLRRESLKTQVIVVSGYDHFAYTHAALMAKGVDYLLKPFRKKDLEQALTRAVTAWREQESSEEEENHSGFRIRQAEDLLDEHKLAGYLKGEFAFHEGIRHIFARRGLPAGSVTAAMLLPSNRSDIQYRRFQGDVELFAFALHNIAHEVLEPYNPYYLCRLDDEQWVLLTFWGSSGMMPSKQKFYIEKLAQCWLDTLGLKMLIGIHEGEAGAETLPQAIAGARAALLMCDVISGVPQRKDDATKLPSLAERRIFLETALQRKDKAYVAEIVRSFAQELKDRGTLRLKDLQGYTYEANLLLEKAYRDRPSDNNAAVSFMPLWIADIDEWQRLFAEAWCSLIDRSGGGFPIRSIEAIHEYITLHFQEDISLAMLSRKFNFNPWYIARKFKETYGTTIITYLTELRVERAKSLLVGTNISVSEMAGLLGYTDENYFGKVFKKQTGLSPLQFRKENRHV